MGSHLEGPTQADDCLIECANALIWIEGKRFDWLDPSTKWDVTRDQIARNIDALASRAGAAGKDYRLLICHEQPLKHHEKLLLAGYRSGTWPGGLPHGIDDTTPGFFAARIGTLTWSAIVRRWPGSRNSPGVARPAHQPGGRHRSLQRFPSCSLSTLRIKATAAGMPACDNGKVQFRWKDYRDGNRQKIMTLDGGEFVRRFLVHVLPDGFHRIRYYGFLGNRHRARKLKRLPGNCVGDGTGRAGGRSAAC